MRKKFLSIALALLLCLGQTVPVITRIPENRDDDYQYTADNVLAAQMKSFTRERVIWKKRTDDVMGLLTEELGNSNGLPPRIRRKKFPGR